MCCNSNFKRRLNTYRFCCDVVWNGQHRNVERSMPLNEVMVYSCLLPCCLFIDTFLARTYCHCARTMRSVRDCFIGILLCFRRFFPQGMSATFHSVQCEKYQWWNVLACVANEWNDASVKVGYPFCCLSIPLLRYFFIWCFDRFHHVCIFKFRRKRSPVFIHQMLEQIFVFFMTIKSGQTETAIDKEPNCKYDERMNKKTTEETSDCRNKSANNYFSVTFWLLSCAMARQPHLLCAILLSVCAVEF